MAVLSAVFIRARRRRNRRRRIVRVAAYYEFMMGLQLEGQGDSAGASAAYQRAERLDPQSAEIPAALAELYVRMNRPADAVAAGERAVKANPDQPGGQLDSREPLRAHVGDAGGARRRSPHLHAARHNESRKGQANSHPAVPMILGRLYLADDQHEKAVAMLAPFVNEQPEQVEAVALLAEAYQATDRDDDAIALLEKSVQDAPELYSALGQVYQDAGRWRDAARAYQGAVEERPQSLRSALAVGHRSLEPGRREAGARGARAGRRATHATARALSAVGGAAAHARLRGCGGDGAPLDCARYTRAHRPRQLGQILRPERASENRCAARADCHRALQGGGRGRHEKRYVPRHVFRPRAPPTRGSASTTRPSRC